MSVTKGRWFPPAGLDRIRLADHDSTRSDRLSSSVAKQRFVMWSFLSNCEKVASRKGPGRQARSASRALQYD